MSPLSEQEDLIQSRITDWLERNNEDLSGEERRDIAFHMTDWFSDYEELRAFFDDPKNATDQTIENALGMLYHAPHHLAAAARIYTGLPVSDVFGIGATSLETADD